MQTHQPPRTMRDFLKFILGMAAGTAVTSLLMYGCVDGVVREDEARDSLRADRCARETAPAGYTQAAWDSYCKAVGQ